MPNFFAAWPRWAMAVVLGIALAASALAAAATAAPGEIFFTILHTNDEHSALIPSPLVDDHPTEANPALGGFARLAGAVGEIRAAKDAEGERVFLVSAADYMGGSAFSWLSLEGKAPELSLMLELGYDVATIGNHEYDHGPEVLARYLADAGFPNPAAGTVIVASNTHPPAGHPLANLGIEETHLVQVDANLTVGFLGLLGEDGQQKAPVTKPVEFSDPHEAARRAAQELKAAGADIIVALTHSGEEEDRLLARAVPEIDIIVGGHCHTALEEPLVVGETLIVQAGSYLKNLGILELGFNPTTGKLRVRNPETGRPHLLPLDHRVPADPVMAARVEDFTGELNALIQAMTGGRFRNIADTVAYTSFPLPNTPFQESPLRNFVADAMRFGAQEALGERVDFAFQFNGTLRGDLVPGSMAYSRDKVSFYDLVDLVGLGSGPDGRAGYPLVSTYLTGEEVRRALEVFVLLSEMMGNAFYPQLSGLRMNYDPARAILFWVPVKNIPVPTTRAVLKAERYIGEGIQQEGEFVSLERGDETLYHVVVDNFAAAFLPMVGDLLPSLALVPKDREGNPVDIAAGIIYRDGQELKMWQTVVEYAAAQPPGPDGNPWIPGYYDGAAGRLVQVRTIPLLLWPGLALLFLLALLLFFLKRRRAGKRRASGSL